jgi:hypothetical protein
MNIRKMWRVAEAAARAGYYTVPVQTLLRHALPYDYGNRIEIIMPDDADEDGHPVSWGRYVVADYDAGARVTLRKLETLTEAPADV